MTEHTSNQRSRPKQGKLLTLIQNNIGYKSGANHDALLNRAWEAKADIILIQEPWTAIIDGKRKTKTHPRYDTFIPVENWSLCPRVITYVRKDPRLQAQQLRPFTSRDICWVEINGITVCNVYRDAQGNDLVLSYLESLAIQGRVVIGGDFNAVNWLWQPKAKFHKGPGARIANWILNNDLIILNTDAPTHRKGNILDLTITNIEGAEACLDPSLHIGSDHFTIKATIPAGALPPPPIGRFRIHLDRILAFAQLVQQHSPTREEKLHTPEQIDRATDKLMEALDLALKSTGCLAHNRGRNATWWNKECEDTLKELQLAIKEAADKAIIDESCKSFQRTVRRAKKQYWQDIIAKANSDKAIYKISGWHKLADSFKSPPITHEGIVYTDTKAKIELLRDKVLTPMTDGEDITDPWRHLNEFDPDTIHVNGRNEDSDCSHPPIPWDHHIPMAEVEDACLNTRNTSPGKDGINTNLIRTVWPSIGLLVKDLYEACLKIGYHPKAFRSAEVVMLPKVGKIKFDEVKSWRPISLLCCLSKGLERVIARRMATLTINNSLLNSQHFGALPKRSAVDLAACVTHDVEEAFRDKKVASLLTMDVSGAFNTVLKGRLILRLRQQGWHENLVKWVEAFMTERSASVRMEGVLAEPQQLNCGVPQGSPISPILFMLYIEPLLKLGKLRTKFGYADDIAILRIGDTEKNTVKALTEDIDQILEWGNRNAIYFDPNKCELVHFSRKAKKPQPPVHTSGFTVQPKESIRWLGVYFDRTLSFTRHISEWSSKGLRVANHLKSLNRTTKGSPPHATAKAAATCVLPILTYGAEAWWPGTSWPSQSKEGTEVNNGLKERTAKIDKAIRTAARAALPVWKTTPIPVLHRESGLPPAEVLLEQIRLRSSLRLRKLDQDHPLIRRLTYTPKKKDNRGRKPEWERPPPLTRLQRTAQLTPSCPRPKLLPRRWRSGRIPVLTGKKEGKEIHDNWHQKLKERDLVLYSDGSQDRQTGWGFVAYMNDDLIYQQHGSLKTAEVFDAEITGAQKAAEWAVENKELLRPQRYHFCLDNTAVIYSLLGHPSDNSQEAFLQFYRMQEKLQPSQSLIHWSPGHMGIRGNEAADKEAGIGSSAKLSLEEERVAEGQMPSLTYVRRINRRQRRDLLVRWWADHTPDSYKPWNLPIGGKLEELKLPRASLHRLLAERSGHGDFASYHRRFNHEESSITPCGCGEEKEPGHFVECELAAAKLPSSLRPGRERKEMLGYKGHTEFLAYLKAGCPYGATEL